MSDYAFTSGVRLALMRSRDHAGVLHNEYVGTEHLLLAVLDETDGTAAAVLDRLGVDRAAIRATIEGIITPGTSERTGPELPYTSRSRKVLELAMMAARNEGVDFVGTEHLLLGLLHEQMGIGAQVLTQAGISAEAATGAIRELR